MTQRTAIAGTFKLLVSAAITFGSLVAGALHMVSTPAIAASPTAPVRAAGLWELKHVGGGGTVIGTQTLCVSAASEAKENVFSGIALNVNCRKYVTTRAGEAWAFEFVCGPAEMTSTTAGTISGDFATTYTINMTENDGMMELKRTINATRKGACPLGVDPGALMDETGKVIANTLN